MKHLNLIGIAVMATAILSSACTGGKKTIEQEPYNPFVTVKEGEFYIGDSVYRYVGSNFWYGVILASEGRGGDRKRLARELDTLQAIGINNLRILVGGDGAEGLHSHISPMLQTRPGEYNDTLLRGLDYLLDELERRDMKAVLYLNNSWEWSGGFSTYLEWAGAGKAVIPNIDGYQAYVDYAAKFSVNDSAQKLAANHVRNIVSRTNSITGRPYSESPAIMAWQIANEPRCFSDANKEYFAKWIRETATLIKDIDPNHLVSTGSEGSVGCQMDIDLWSRIHSYPEIDYATIHIWPKNWGWVTAETMTDSIGVATRETTEYINSHYEALRKALNSNGTPSKPLVLEEFGYPRDGMAYRQGTSVSSRDEYYRHIFSEVKNGGKINGTNFWAWGGLAEPRHEIWQPGDDYTGDPAQEPQGLYSVFASDTTTIAIIRQAIR
ncbi:MAG: beta-galactosidase [Muribaculaceae bacterium]|nr:beta-galactosidase [Muribaculaceae bacterium]MDE6194285.1 beta-galactosidase [Muribaculaceae bacterium]